MFATRLISGIIMLIVAFLTIGKSGLLLISVLLSLSMIGYGELLKIEKFQFSKIAVFGYLSIVGYYSVLYVFGFSPILLIPVVCMFLITAVLFVAGFPKYEPHQVMLSVFAYIYVPLMLSFLYLTRISSEGAVSVWLIFIGAWGADTCAYCIGMLFGKRKLAPVLSPKKSVEGAVGGVIGASLLGFLYAYVFYKLGKVPSTALFAYPITCFFASILSIFGDLFASAIKRKYDLKDYGSFIPGHGGVLDRFDSILFVAPVIYYVTELLNYLF